MAKAKSRQVASENDIYTALLALATLIVVAAAAFVAFKCQAEYGTFFTIGK